jgi:hypothetical protein
VVRTWNDGSTNSGYSGDFRDIPGYSGIKKFRETY